MSKDPTAKRPLGRELFAVVLAFVIAYLIGRSIVQSIGSPPFIVTALIFLGLYMGSYFLLWQISGRVFRGR
jgi:hypothetical protein